MDLSANGPCDTKRLEKKFQGLGIDRTIVEDRMKELMREFQSFD